MVDPRWKFYIVSTQPTFFTVSYCILALCCIKYYPKQLFNQDSFLTFLSYTCHSEHRALAKETMVSHT